MASWTSQRKQFARCGHKLLAVFVTKGVVTLRGSCYSRGMDSKEIRKKARTEIAIAIKHLFAAEEILRDAGLEDLARRLGSATDQVTRIGGQSCFGKWAK